MRFLNTQTYEVGEHADPDTQRYAILSHRWAAKEVTFQQLESEEQIAKTVQLPQFAKIRGACAKAASLGYQWLWIDTCCINKQDNAELTESLNSMYNWYSQAAECLIYLSDVDRATKLGRSPFTAVGSNSTHPSESVWFTRGWTLQELLACRTARFYDLNWIEIGTKAALAAELERITGVEASYLNHRKNLQLASIATKLSWACSRTTTRQEDRVYSLVGLFDVYLPILYGEGLKKAFRRLQLELLKTPDESIFAWTLPRLDWQPPPGYDDDEYGLLAPSIECFQDAGGITHINRNGYQGRVGGGYSMVQSGVMFPVPMQEFNKGTMNPYTVATLFVPFVNLATHKFAQHRRDKKGFPLTLNCWTASGDRVGAPVQIWIRKGDGSSTSGVWRRFCCDEWRWGTKVAKAKATIGSMSTVMEMVVAQP